MKAKNTTTEPKVDFRPAKPYVGIRTIAPFEGMFAVVTTLLKELRKWVNQHNIADQGPFFHRYHSIDMKGPMDFEVGFMLNAPLPGDERVKPAVLPAGRYANLIYTGSGMTGNKTLIGWARSSGVTLDRWDGPQGDVFACRYEAYLTDYRLESRKMLWDIDLAIKVVDE
jgi:effector-binding domain-containing protein